MRIKAREESSVKKQPPAQSVKLKSIQRNAIYNAKNTERAAAASVRPRKSKASPGTYNATRAIGVYNREIVAGGGDPSA